MKNNPHRIEFTVGESFKTRVRLLAAKWRVRSNVAIQRAVELALARESSDDEKALLKIISVRTEEILRHIHPE
jgi:hypothetical protein